MERKVGTCTVEEDWAAECQSCFGVRWRRWRTCGIDGLKLLLCWQDTALDLLRSGEHDLK
jgi:hypothetical protein